MAWASLNFFLLGQFQNILDKDFGQRSRLDLVLGHQVELALIFWLQTLDLADSLLGDGLAR